jgi:hypothetical protein
LIKLGHIFWIALGSTVTIFLGGTSVLFHDKFYRFKAVGLCTLAAACTGVLVFYKPEIPKKKSVESNMENSKRNSLSDA